jgi:DNA-binding NarL/FixJ family response regulator
VLLLSPDLEVLAETAPAVAYLAELLPPSADQPPVPASAYNVAAQLIAREAGVDDQPALARVNIGAGRWLALRAARLEGEPREATPIAVTIEEASTGERLEIFALANGLSARETELLRHLDAGLDTHDIAARMFLSEHTVNDHAKAIFAKTGIRTRLSVAQPRPGMTRPPARRPLRP